MENNIAVVGTGYWGKNPVRNFAELETEEWDYVVDKICEFFG